MKTQFRQYEKMSKTMKFGLTLYIALLFVIVGRMIVSNLNIADNYITIIFTCIVQVFGFGIVPLVLCIILNKRNPLVAYRVNFKINPAIYFLAIPMGFLLYLMTIGVST
ncbi:MAG: hypothetical protein K5765_07960, partial [Clostridia bacterium]|nr:hypothetical protein [Clostridia bacterium]